MANNRVELATLPRHIDQVPGKSTASGLLLETDLIAFNFSTLNAANAVITDMTTYTDRINDNTLALIGATTESSLYRYVRGAARTNDAWNLVGSADVTLSNTTAAAVDGTAIQTYTIRVGSTALTPTIPVATWAQDTSTQIPRQKLPDTSYGDQYFFPSTADRNARTNATNAAGTAVPPANIIWHQNDVAVTGTGSTRIAWIYIGVNQTGTGNTTDAAWLRLGQPIQATAINQYVNITNRANGTSTNTSNTFTYNVNSDGNQISITTANFTFPTSYVLSVNGVVLILGLDYTTPIVNNSPTISFVSFRLASVGTDSVSIIGSSLS